MLNNTVQIKRIFCVLSPTPSHAFELFAQSCLFYSVFFFFIQLVAQALPLSFLANRLARRLVSESIHTATTNMAKKKYKLVYSLKIEIWRHRTRFFLVLGAFRFFLRGFLLGFAFSKVREKFALRISLFLALGHSELQTLRCYSMFRIVFVLKSFEQRNGHQQPLKG